MKRIFTNISFNLLIRLSTYAFSFLTVLYVARILQPEAFGKISFASSFSGCFVMLANLGMPIYAMRACAEKRNDRKELSGVFNELWSISLVLSVISAAVFLATVLLVPKLWEDHFLLAIYGSTIFFQMIGCEWLFRGLEQFRFLAVTGFLCKAVSLLCIVLFVHSEAHTIRYAVFSVLTAYGSNIACFSVLRRHVDLSFHININKKHFRPLLIFSLMSWAVYIYSSLDLTMLGFMQTEFETGLYSIAAKGKSVLVLTGDLVWSSILPLAANLWKNGERARFESLAAKALLGVCGIQFLVTVICLIFAEEIILFVGGESYLGAVAAFRILLFSLVPIGASNILGGQVLIPAGKEHRLLTAEILGAVFNFTANLILIPHLSIIGAAITTVVAEIIVWLVCTYYAKKDLAMDFGFGLLVRVIRRIKRILFTAWVRIENKRKRAKLPLYCPCCDTYLKQFIDADFDKHPDIYNTARYMHINQNVICPICGSLPRHRILASWLDENAGRIKGKKILHFAPEQAVRIWMKRNGVSAVTADLADGFDLKLDIQATGLPDASYDIIICNHVLEHVDDFRAALKEMFRILRADGEFICSFPMDPNVDLLDEDPAIQTPQDRIRRFGQNDHLRVFGMKADRFLAEAGFTVERIAGENYPDKILPVVGPADYDMNLLFRCRK